MFKNQDQYFELAEKLKLNTANFAAYKANRVTGILKKLPNINFNDNAIQVIKNYNRYQAAEYNTIVARSRSAKQWMQFEKEAELYPNIEWLATASSNPRELHKRFVGIILPQNDKFWKENQPGNLWNCKCNWRTSDKPVTDKPKSVPPAPGLDGNPAQSGEIFTDKHPYIEKAPERIIDSLKTINYKDTESNLQINILADKSEIADNVITGRILSNNHNEMDIKINGHFINGDSNPEFDINGLISDAKRLKKYSGITNGFRNALGQGCNSVIIDFNKHFDTSKSIDIYKVVGRIYWRKADFENDIIKECYIVYGKKSCLINKEHMDRQILYDLIKGLMP